MLLLLAANAFALQSRAVTLEGQPVTVSVSIPSLTAKSQPVLKLEGVQTSPGQGAIIRVFVGLPEAGPATSVDNEHFAGYVTLLAHSAGKGNSGNMTLNLPPPIERNLRARRAVDITLVPMSKGPVRIEKILIAP